MGVARCPANQFLYDRVRQALTLAELQKQENPAFAYRRVLHSLEAYPVPIVCLRQAAALEGVGMRLLALLDDAISTHYAKWLKAPRKPPIIEQCDPPIRRVNPAPAVVGCPRATAAERQILARVHSLEGENAFRRFFTLGELAFKKHSLKLVDALVQRGLLQSLEVEGELRYGLSSLGSAALASPVEARSQRSRPPSPKLEAAIQKPKELIGHRVFVNVDSRERYSAELISFEEKLAMNGQRVKRRNLPLGDFLWTVELDWQSGAGEYVLEAIVERKTVNDLARSVIDGRFAEQRKRLSACGIARRYLLVEGSAEGHPFTALTAALASARAADGFVVLRAADAKEAADRLTRLGRALSAELERRLAAGETPRTTYVEFARAQRRLGNITVKNAAQNALCQLPSVGEATANRLLAFCPTLSALRREFVERKVSAEIGAALSAKQKAIFVQLFTESEYFIESYSQP